MKKIVILASIVAVFIMIVAPVNAKVVSVDVTGTWDLLINEYIFGADGTLLDRTYINVLLPDVLVIDQKPNGTLSGYYTYINPGIIEYGTWEDIGNAVRYNINDNNVPGEFAYYSEDSNGKYVFICESFGLTVFKNNHNKGYGSLSGSYYKLNEGTGEYDEFVCLVLRTFVMER